MKISMVENKLPIGVFDSGVGGLTVVKELKKAFPSEDIIYLGDTARVPYGSKSAETVSKYALACSNFLTKKGIKFLVVACNTASSFALETLKKELTIPFTGVIQPGARAAKEISKNGHIGVIGTRGTINSGSYERAIKFLDGGTTVVGQACPLLVPIAEEGWENTEVDEKIAERYLGELNKLDPEIDTLILGCTHYPLLRSVIEKIVKKIFKNEVQIVDSAVSTAREVSEVIEKLDLKNPEGEGKFSCYVTDDSRIQELSQRFLGGKVECERVDL